MSRISLLALLISVSSFANVDLSYIDQNFCKDVVEQRGARIRTNPLLFTSNAYGDYFLQKKAIEGGYKYLLVSGLGEKELPSYIKAVRDFTAVEDKLYLLTKDKMIELTRRGRVLNQIDIPEAFSIQTYARSMVYSERDNALFLAQGKLGLTKYDLNTLSFTSRYPLNTTNQSGHLSSAVSVSMRDSQMFVVMTGRSEKGFNGVVVFEPATNTIINEAEYDRRRVGVIFPYASVYTNNNGVYINNAGWIHHVSYKDVLNKKKIRPRWRAIEYTTANYRQYITLKGDLIFGNQGVMGCGVIRNISTDKLSGKAFSYR